MIMVLAFSMLSYVLAGYLLGLTIGFTLFDPNLDVYALLGAVLAIFGAFLGVIPFFRRSARYVFGAVVGFYLGALVSILLFGNPLADDLLEVLQRGGAGLLLMWVISIAGSVSMRRSHAEKIALPAVGLLMGGFLGGYLFGIVLGLAPNNSLVALAPFVIGSGAVFYAGLWFLQRSTSRMAATAPSADSPRPAR